MTSETRNKAIPVIVDTDPGVDDAVAILMLLGDPTCEIVGFTTTAGNVPLARSTRNTLALLEYAGRLDIPVCRGAARPVRGRFAYARHVHSAAGLTRRLPDPSMHPSEIGAVQFMERTLMDTRSPVTVIALGPLTNLARLWRRNPAALQSAERIVVMGGAVHTEGNATPHAEFNFYSDPTAARIIMESGLPITLIDLAACRQVSISRDQAHRVRSASRLGTLAAELLHGWFDRDPARQDFHLYDPLAALAVTHPHVVELDGTTMTVVDSDVTDDGAMWGKCEVVDANQGPTLVAAPDRVDSAAAHSAIQHLLEWT
ncbi:MAG: nucleoside hydrolase [Chloroflexi bacterium]|nr:nucleoside hydrolase [Chloroflexota bacterium]